MIQNTPQNEFPSDEDRFFDAMRYVLDEMSADEADQFENQLAVDQSLRELVAEAVLLSQATYSSHLPETVPSEPVKAASIFDMALRNSSQIGYLAALALVLLVAALAGLPFYLGSNDSDQASITEQQKQQGQVAAVWVENIESQSLELSGLWEEIPLEEEMPLGTADSVDQLLAENTVSPPAWMLKALAAQQEDDETGPAM
ncbi:hypothetical protein GC197_07430 [bacterium]|nr:hypothetical protein [bacterium]